MTYTLKAGQIILFEKGAFDPPGSFITAQERDTNICHAAFVGKNGKIWTTGAHKLLFYGQVDAQEYLKNRTYHVAEFDNLQVGEIELMDMVAQSLEGQIYGGWKVALLIFKSQFGGIVRQLYPWLTKTVKHPFCSEAVAYAAFKAGRDVFTCLGKAEPSAITPANLYMYARAKGTDLNIVYSSI